MNINEDEQGKIEKNKEIIRRGRRNYVNENGNSNELWWWW